LITKTDGKIKIYGQSNSGTFKSASQNRRWRVQSAKSIAVKNRIESEKAHADSRRCDDRRKKCAVFSISLQFPRSKRATNSLQFEGARVSSKHRRACSGGLQ
jgi:hypothetical protein